MKKIITIVLAVFMVASVMIPMLTVSATDNPSFVVGDASGKVGDNVDVTVSINNNPGITALQIKIDYSDEKLELVKISDGGLFDNAVTNSKLSNKPFKISWYSAESVDESDNGVLVTLTFKILKDVDKSEVAVSYDVENVFDIGFNDIYFDTVNGIIDVQPENETTITEPSTTDITENASGSTEPDHPFLLGDANLDAAVNIKDATEIQKYVASLIDLSDEAKFCADFDQNENINIKDATGIQKRVAGLI